MIHFSNDLPIVQRIMKKIIIENYEASLVLCGAEMLMAFINFLETNWESLGKPKPSTHDHAFLKGFWNHRLNRTEMIRFCCLKEEGETIHIRFLNKTV